MKEYEGRGFLEVTLVLCGILARESLLRAMPTPSALLWPEEGAGGHHERVDQGAMRTPSLPNRPATL